MKKACREFRESWTARPGRSVDDATAKAQDAHAAVCPSCAAFAGSQAAALAALAPLAAARRAALPPEDLAERIVARIQREAVAANAAEARPVPFLLRSATRRTAPVAAGLAVFLAVGVWFGLYAGGALTPAKTPDVGGPTQSESGYDAITDASATNAPTDKAGGTPVTEANSGAAPRLVATDLRQSLVTGLKALDPVPPAYAALAGSDALDGAYAFRCYQNADASLTVLVLLPAAGIQDRADRVSAVLAPCASPFRIEIIDAKDIAGAFRAMGLSGAESFLSAAGDAPARLLRVDLGR